jgi:hypothetical protein
LGVDDAPSYGFAGWQIDARSGREGNA